MVRRPPRCLIYPNLLSRTVRQDKQASHPPALFLPDFHIFCIFYSIYSPFLQSPNPRSSETAVSCTIIHIKDRTLLSTFNRKQQCESTWWHWRAVTDTVAVKGEGFSFKSRNLEVLPGQVLIQSRARNEKKNIGNKWHLLKSNLNPSSPRYRALSTLDIKKKKKNVFLFSTSFAPFSHFLHITFKSLFCCFVQFIDGWLHLILLSLSLNFHSVFLL